MQRVDYLLIGQGLSGSMLAVTLLQKGRSVAVIDQPQLSSSSRVAAGAYNPFNFRRMTDNWRAGELVDFVNRFYPEAESFLGSEGFFHPRRVLKVFAAESERQQWEKACAAQPQRFASPEILENYYADILDTPFGIGVVKEAGHIDTVKFIGDVSAKLEQQQSLFRETFDPSKLSLSGEGAVYDNRIAATTVIFCEGHLARKDHWFGFLPLRPVKGQVLHVHIPGFDAKDIFNRGAYLVPMGNERFATGATFENDRDDETITPNAEEELLGKLTKYIRVPIHVEKRFAGVRPAVKDRRPLLGRHPEHPQLCVFNGMGSKAVLLAPFLADQLVQHLEEKIPLLPEVDIARFA